MRAERFGSYSIAATVATTPSLSRLISIMRYAFLAPPPMKRLEMRPRASRPPVRFLPSSSDFSGVSLVMSSRVRYVWKRRGGVTGLKLLIGIWFYLASLNLGVLGDLLSRGQPHIRFFPVRGVAGKTTPAAQLAHEVTGSHIGNLDAEHGLDRLLNLKQERLRMHFKAQRALVLALI